MSTQTEETNEDIASAIGGFIDRLKQDLVEARKCAEEWREHCLKRHVMSQIVSSKLPWEEKE